MTEDQLDKANELMDERRMLESELATWNKELVSASKQGHFQSFIETHPAHIKDELEARIAQIDKQFSEL